MRCLRLIIISAIYLGVAFTGKSQMNSLSYAFGYETSIGLLAGENTFFATDADSKEFIRGLEENIPIKLEMNDTSYIRNYSLGVMQGGQMANSMAANMVNWESYVSYVIEGLKAVAYNKVSVPADTIGLEKRLAVLTPPETLSAMSEKEKRLLYKEYGILNYCQLDLQQLLDKHWNGAKANHAAYLEGFIGVLENINPVSSYDLGRLMAKTQVANVIAWPDFSIKDYVEGAKAALGQSEPLMSRSEIELFIDKIFSNQTSSAQSGDERKTILIGNRQYISGSSCDVDWRVRVYPTAVSGACSNKLIENYNDAIRQIINRFDIKEMIPLRFNDLMKFFRHPVVEREEFTKYVDSLNHEMVKGYKLFCFKSMGGEWTVGLAIERDAFEAVVEKAVIEVYDEQKPVVGLSFFFDNPQIMIGEWADFTRNNIGRTVIVEINGEVVMAPVINSEIESGACSITTVSVEEIEHLLTL